MGIEDDAKEVGGWPLPSVSFGEWGRDEVLPESASLAFDWNRRWWSPLSPEEEWWGFENEESFPFMNGTVHSTKVLERTFRTI